MLSLLEPSLFGENNSLFEEVFEDLLQALGLGRAQFENPSSLRSLTGPDLKGLLPAAQSISLGWGRGCQVLHLPDCQSLGFLGGGEERGLFQVQISGNFLHENIR